MSGALAGLRAIELGQLIAGPFCGQLMADHGAELIKVEAPGSGDPMRSWGQGKPVWFSVIGRNKKCITLNLREPEGQDILKRLIEKTDILVENFRPGTMEKWSLGYDALKAINRGLIMVRVSGFGQTGPYAHRAGYGSIGEAMGGMRYLAGDPSLPPSRAGLSIGDALTAIHACMGALLALEVRHRTGEGQMIDSALYESVLAMMESTVAEYSEAGHIRERTGSTLPKIAPSNVYPTSDGDILIAANQDSVWRRLATVMEKPELADDPRFATHIARGDNQVELDALISRWSETQDADSLLKRLEANGVPAGKIFTAPDMMSDPQFIDRQSLVKVDHPEFKNLWMQNVFPKLSATPGGIKWPGPMLGEHNTEIYGELLGLSSREQQSLSDRGII